MKTLSFRLQVLIMFMCTTVSSVVVQQVRFIVTKNGRTDYALAGETVELTCHYMMKDEVEDVKQVLWSKDGSNIFRWRKNRTGLEVLSYVYKGHLDPSSSHSRITIHDVGLDMHGRYRCAVKTDLGWHEMEHEVIVISRTNCKLSDWRVASEPSKCQELIQFDCRHMFPKPVPSCGLWNAKTDKFIRSVVMDISEEPTPTAAPTGSQPQTPPKQPTYRVRYGHRMELQLADARPNPAFLDLLPFAGQLVFKCDISVPDTSWRLSMSHRMFDFQDGCNEDPLETIERMRHNYSQYASSRLRHSGYLLEPSSSASQPPQAPPAADLEMLGPSLKYELFAPAHTSPPDYQRWLLASSSRIPARVNCWQRPRYGSLARLSCASHQGASGRQHHVKLIGANTLQCQPSGWVPVSQTNVRRPRQDRGQAAQTVQDARRDGGEEDENFLIVPEINSSPSKPTIAQSTTQPHSNDLDYSSPAASSSPTPMVSSGDSQNAQTIARLASGDQLDYIPTTQTAVWMASIKSSQLATEQYQFAPITQMSPSQLASLLPTCVSISQRRPSASHPDGKHQSYPLRDSNDRGHLLESTQDLHQHNHRKQQTQSAGISSIFSFYSSSSSPSLSSSLTGFALMMSMIPIAAIIRHDDWL